MILGKDIHNGAHIGLSDEALLRHAHISGLTGAGKSVLIENLALDLAERPWGFCLIDLHGGLSRTVADKLPDHRFWKDATYWDLSEDDFLGINPIKDVPKDRRPLVSDNIVSIFVHLFRPNAKQERNFYDAVGQRLLGQSLRLLMDNELSLIELAQVLTDFDFRTHLLEHCSDAAVKDFWQEEFAGYSDRQRVDYTTGLLADLDYLTTNPSVTRALKHGNINPLRYMNEGRILIINLSKGKLGEKGACFLGALVATMFAQAAYEREGMADKEMTNFALIVDEFQNITTTAMVATVSEARKYHLGLIAGHQFLGQLDHSLRDAIMGSVGNRIVFRCGGADAELYAKDFDPFPATRLVDLSRYHAAVRTYDSLDVVEVETLPPRPSRGCLAAVRKLTASRNRVSSAGG
jgi:hypothetical protein